MGTELSGAVAMLCRDARSCKSWTRVGDKSSPTRLCFLIVFKKSLIAAINTSFAAGRGGVTDVSGNQATVSVMRADVAVT